MTFVNQIAQLLHDEAMPRFPTLRRSTLAWCQAMEWASAAPDAVSTMAPFFVQDPAAQDIVLLALADEAAHAVGDLRADALHRLACAAIYAAAKAAYTAETARGPQS